MKNKKLKKYIKTLKEIKLTLNNLEDSVNIILHSLNSANNDKSSKKKIALFIDGENFSYKKIEGLLLAMNSIGVLSSATIYDRSIDKTHWRQWCNIANNYHLSIRQVQGKPKKDMVDNIIINDIYQKIANKKDDFDIFCLASADGDYATVLQKAKDKGKQIIIAHTSSVSNKLRKICDEVIKVK